jgi:hypothetical protein
MSYLQTFRRAVRSVDGKRLVTTVQKRAFRVHVRESGLSFTPESYRLPRLESWTRVDAFLRRHCATQSQYPKDYLDVTRNSSYLLALLLYVDFTTPAV